MDFCSFAVKQLKPTRKTIKSGSIKVASMPDDGCANTAGKTGEELKLHLSIFMGV